MPPSLRVYGVPLSQPFRSVVWALLQKKESFSIGVTTPGVKGNHGTLSATFREKSGHRFNSIPFLEYIEEIDTYPGSSSNSNHSVVKTTRESSSQQCIFESPAILTHLCLSRPGWEDLYAPPGSLAQAHIDSYLHWHHSNTRQLAKLVAHWIRPEIPKPEADTFEACHSVLECLDTAWLGNNNNSTEETLYLVNNQYSIADILCYGELSQVYFTHMVDIDSDYPNIQRWMGRMREQPWHDAVHTALTTLGTLHGPVTPRRLTEAHKAGSAAITQAMEQNAAERAAGE